MKNPLITIVVPVYKVPERLLRNCLDSICAQTSSNFETLLVDDGSPDTCGAICDEYAERHGFVRVIHQQNGGLSVARNVGIDEAAGDWVCFVDGDDWIEADTMSFATDYVLKYPQADVLIWDEYYDVDGISVENYFFGKRHDETFVFQGTEVRKILDRMFSEKGSDFTESTLVNIGTANARLYRVDFLRKNKLYNKPGLKKQQDFVFNLWVFSKARFVCYTDCHLYHYVYNENAITKKYTPDIADTIESLYHSIMEYLTHSKQEAVYKQCVYVKFIRIIASMFELNYAHPNNKDPIYERIREARKDMQRPCFAEIIANCDTSRQCFQVKLIHGLLYMHFYIPMFVITRVKVLTRKKRIAQKRG